MKTQTARLTRISRFISRHKTIGFIFAIMFLSGASFVIAEKVSTQTREIRASRATKKRENSSRDIEKNASKNLQSPAACAQSPANLVSWYRGENDANDSQGTNNGTLQNSVGFASGKIGQAFNFTAAGQSVQVPDNSSLDLTNQVTLEAWIAPSQFGTGNGSTTIISKMGPSPNTFNTGGYNLNWRQDGRIGFGTCRGSQFGPFCMETVSSVLPLNAFSHVVGTYDGQTVRIYIDGVLQPGAQSYASPQPIGVNDTPLTVAGNGTADYFGLIDEASIYDRALTDTEIQSIFNAGSAGKCSTSPPLQISPATANVTTGGTVNFTASGGSAPYAFSILINNSGGSINSSTGAYTAGNYTGADTVRVADTNSATADAVVNVSGTATRLAFTIQPTNTVAGQTISPAIQVAIQDANGNTITNSNAAVTLSIANNPNGGTLTGTVTRNAVNGIAAFNDLSINRAGIGYTLQATSGSLTTATSSAFNITTGAANRLAFVVQPSNTTAGATITPAVQVAVQDAFGNAITTANDAITIAVGNNLSGGTLSGTLTRNAVGGVAAFNNLSINNFGGGYTLIASSGSLTQATSAAFNIISQFEVTNTNDSGAGSLRQVILNANTAVGTQTITFSITGNAPFLIKPLSRLPPISGAAIIDGTTQPAFVGAPVVELSGELVPDSPGTGRVGIFLNGDGSAVKGLTINNWGTGILSNAVAAEIKGNYIGTDATGAVAKPNSVGISILNGYAIIGGLTTADRNVISGNTSAGIVKTGIDYPVASRASGNYIGTKADGVSPLGNGTGIFVFGKRISIGILAGNVIAFNVQNGIEISSPGNRSLTGEAAIFGNSIHSNGGRGIKIGYGFSPTLNDPLDTDEGNNSIQNYPVITSVASSGGVTVIEGTLNSTPSTTFNVGFFYSDVCDSSGYGEGKTSLTAFGDITTDASGIASFHKTVFAPVPIGSFLTATARTDDGTPETSEFSRCQVVAGSAHSIAGQIVDTNNAPMSGVVVQIQGTNFSTLTNSGGNYSFNNLPGGFNYTITPEAQNVTFAPANRVINNLSADQTNQNFTGTRISRVSGQIMSDSNGASFALGGATVTLNGANGFTQTVLTDVNGNYTFINVPPGNYTATPTMPTYVFSPASFPVNTNNGTQITNFAASSPLVGRILGGYINVGAMNADGSNEVYLLNGLDGPASGCIRFPCQIALDARLSRDGGKIAYVEATSTRFDGFLNKRIYVVNFDGSNKQLVYSYPASESGFSANALTWSPDGLKLVFEVGQRSLHTINIDGTNETTVVSGSQPDWSPDGTKILFNSNQAINVVNIDGTNQVQLTSGSIDGDAKWSPDGSKIAFIRRPALNPPVGRIFTMNADGSAQTAITADSDFANVLWSPDGTKLAFVKRGSLPTNNFYGVMNPNGSNLLIIKTIAGGITSWSPIFAPVTPNGANVSTNVGAANVTFSNVTAAGITTITPIPSHSAGGAPNGFFLIGQSYEITTTAAVTPPITVCFTLPAEGTQERFNTLSILHKENGVLIDRTSSRDFPTRQICASVSSLSPFAIAERIDANLPRITGLVRDTNGNLLVNVPVFLTGAATANTTTDSSGLFSFVNLTAGANYNVQPKQVGYLFTEYNQDFVNLSGEQTVVFNGAASAFQIGGQIVDDAGNGVSGVTVELGGAARNAAQTDASGNYAFADLPADGFYTITPSNGINSFSPANAFVDPLTANAGGVDFQILAPSAAMVSVGGRVLTAGGRGISRARVDLTGADGATRTTYTNTFGYYRFEAVAAGETYVFNVRSKRYRFATNTSVLFIGEGTSDVTFTALP